MLDIPALTAIIEQLLAMVRLGDWTVSHDGKRIGPVTEAHCGVKNGEIFWARFQFEEKGTPHSITGERNLNGSGSAMTLDDVSPPSPEITLKKHLMGFPMPHLSVEIDFDTKTTGGVFRFDARLE